MSSHGEIAAARARWLRRLEDDNPASLRVRKYLTGTHILLAYGPAAVAPTPREQVWQRGPVRLWRYSGSPRRQWVPVVIVYAMVLRPYILDLVSDRSVIASLVDAGHDVWLMDWGDPEPSDSVTALDTYIDDDLRTAVIIVRDASGSKQESPRSPPGRHAERELRQRASG